jgi:undecaprenyl-diphosphatase
MAALSLAGRGGLVWLVIGAIAAIRRPSLRPLLWQVLLAVLLAHVTVDLVLKPAIARGRPFEAMLDARVVGARPMTYSFPSGHAASAVAGAFVTTLMLPRARILLWALAAIIALSRIYVGVHYPLDVVVGAGVGMAVAILVTGGRAWYIRGSSAAQHQWRGSSVGRAPD